MKIFSLVKLGLCKKLSLLSMCFCLWPVAAAQTELSALTKDLPGSFELKPCNNEGTALLSGASEARTTVFRADKLASSGMPLDMLYTDARYIDRAAADIAFEKIMSAVGDTAPGRDEWKIVLQAQNSMHWLQAACALFGASSAENFRQVYANLVKYAETRGVRANRAILCGCESSCMTVAIDR